MVTSALNHKKESSPEEPSVDPLADDDLGELDVSLVDDDGGQRSVGHQDVVLWPKAQQLLHPWCKDHGINQHF